MINNVFAALDMKWFKKCQFTQVNLMNTDCLVVEGEVPSCKLTTQKQELGQRTNGHTKQVFAIGYELLYMKARITQVVLGDFFLL